MSPFTFLIKNICHGLHFPQKVQANLINSGGKEILVSEAFRRITISGLQKDLVVDVLMPHLLIHLIHQVYDKTIDSINKCLPL